MMRNQEEIGTNPTTFVASFFIRAVRSKVENIPVREGQEFAQA